MTFSVESTDNAQVQQQIVPVNSRVQGYIKEIRFKEYQEVKKGDTLVIIDDSDMRLNLARAKADYSNALAGKGIADKSVTSAAANVAVKVPVFNPRSAFGVGNSSDSRQLYLFNYRQCSSSCSDMLRCRLVPNAGYFCMQLYYSALADSGEGYGDFLLLCLYHCR